MAARYLVDYVERELATFDEHPFCPVDAAVLTQACMIDGAGVVGAPSRMPAPLARAIARVASRHLGVTFESLVRAERFDDIFVGLVPEDLKRLRFALVASPRYRDLRISCLRDVFDEASHTQFAACAYSWVGPHVAHPFSFVAFRGTDARIAGWRENFDMVLAPRVNAQKIARAYLDEVAPLLPGELMVGGHSKGGNLALFAALSCTVGVRERIARVFCLDAPGFNPQTFTDAAYVPLAGRVWRCVPQDSVVGMLLDCPIESVTVESSAAGLDQHSVFSWMLEQRGTDAGDGAGWDFVCRDRPNDASLALHDVVAEWLDSMDAAERGRVVDALFDAIAASGARDARDILCGGQDVWRLVLEASRNLDADARSTLRQAVASLAAIAARRAGKDIAEALFGGIAD